MNDKSQAKAVAFRRIVRRFLDDHIAPHIDAWEDRRSFPAREVFAGFGSRGLLGIECDPRWGGLSLGFDYTRTLAEELGSLDCGGIGMSITSHTDMCLPALAGHGNDEVRERFLRPAIAGTAIGAIALTERSGGSDYGGLSTWLRHAGDGYRLTGTKAYITNAGVADFFVVLCRTSDTADISNALTMVVVPADTAGVKTASYVDKLGNHSCDHASIAFENCSVPREYVLGGIGLGYAIQAAQFIRERLVSGVVGLAQARRLLGRALTHAKGRVTFGRRLIEHQAVSDALVDLDARITLVEALLDRCAAAMDGNGEGLGKHSLIVKLHGAALWQQAAELLLRVQAGLGYLDDRSTQRAYRDSRSATIAGGTEETLRRNLVGYLS